MFKVHRKLEMVTRRTTTAIMLVVGAALLPSAAPMPAHAQTQPQQKAPSAPAATPDSQAITPDFRQMRSETQHVHSPQELFAVFDVNQDGCIDDGEWRLRVMAVFFILDAEGTDPVTGAVGGDGQLTRAEVPNLREDVFRVADVDRDGTISAFEFNQASFTRFESIPKQHQNCLTLVEFTTYVQGLRNDAF